MKHKNNLRKCRREKGLTQEQTADAAMVSAQAVWYLENGYRAPSLRMAYAIAAALDMPVQHVFPPELDSAA